MAASTEPRSSIKYGWALGESGWNVGMDANLLKLGRLALGGGILDRDLTAPPGSPSTGAAYIPAAAATGDWVGMEDSIVVYDGLAWVEYEPASGFGVFIADENVWSVFKTGSGWSDGTGHTWT